MSECVEIQLPIDLSELLVLAIRDYRERLITQVDAVAGTPERFTCTNDLGRLAFVARYIDSQNQHYWGTR